MAFFLKSISRCTISRSLSTPLAVWVTALALAALTTSVAYSEVVLREVDGGRDYYRQFSRSLPSNPRYFPIGVWLESVVSQSDINKDKDAGLNLYVGLTRTSNVALIERNGMHVIPQHSEWLRNQSGWPPKAAMRKSRANVGWELFDEIDMVQGPGQGYTTLENIINDLPNDRRMRYNNYGKGVIFWETDSQAERFINGTRTFGPYQHVASVDIYWFTDPHAHIATQGGKLFGKGRHLTYAETRRASNYGATVDRMRMLDGMRGKAPRKRKPIWNFVEVGWPFSESAAQGGRAIEPAEVKAAVWHSIIAGARGIIYFNHSFGGPHHTQHALRDPYYANVRRVVRRTNRLITRLAPVLNAPFARRFVRLSNRTRGSVRTMAKFHRDKYYVFAGSRRNRKSTATFVLSGVKRGTAKVVGENRTIPIKNRRFSDTFADGNAIHIYRILPD